MVYLYGVRQGSEGACIEDDWGVSWGDSDDDYNRGKISNCFGLLPLEFMLKDCLCRIKLGSRVRKLGYDTCSYFFVDVPTDTHFTKSRCGKVRGVG